MRKARIIAAQRDEIMRLDAEVERWRKAYGVLMIGIQAMTTPTEYGSEASVLQAHTRDQLGALATEYVEKVGATL